MEPRELAAFLRDRADVLAVEIARRQVAVAPPPGERPDPMVAERSRDDAASNLEHLAVAIETGRTELFDEHVRWSAESPAAVGDEHLRLRRNLDVVVEVVSEHAGAGCASSLRGIIDASLGKLESAESEPPSFLDGSSPLAVLAAGFLDALLAADRRSATAMVMQAADAGTSIEALYLEVFEPCLREVGRLWQLGRATVGQEHFVTAAVQLVMARLYPRTFDTPRIGRKVLVASVGGELHEVGGRMVADLFELRGWDSYFLGASTPSGEVAQMAAEVGADVVAISATMSTHLAAVGEVIRAVRDVHPAHILVGGRPFNQVPDLWRELGADGTASDARLAVLSAADLVGAS